MGDLASIFKAYDIRGVVPDQLNEDVAEAVREINSQVADQAEATRRVRLMFSGRPGVSTDELDGLTVADGDWWFNLRPSNTEPLLRLNVEAGTEAAMAALRGQVLGIVRGGTRSGPHSAAS